MIATGDGWELRLGDCIEGMRGLADDSVDHVISDPPFSAGLYEKYRTNKRDRENGERRAHTITRGDGRQETIYTRGDERNKTKLRLASNSIGAIDEILDGAAAHLRRLVRRWSVVFSDAEIFDRWRLAFGPDYVRSGAWVKTNPMPQISGDRPGQGFEMATIAHAPGRKRWNGGGRAALWTHATCQGAQRPDHPTPKPLSLMLELVADFTDPGDLVLDPFAGSGTTGVACRQLNRRFLGFEINRDYFDIACRRLRGDEAKPNPAQPSLFGGAP